MTRLPPAALPIDSYLPEILGKLGAKKRLVLVAEPGAGKTTRVPAALLVSAQARNIIVLEPRRIAAMASAIRVAEELGEEVGRRVGYRIRHEVVGGRDTKLWFVTEALLTRKLLSDPTLVETRVLVLDEFHERNVHSDLALALVKELQRTTRPDLQLLVMSATLEAERVASYLDCDVVSVPGRVFPVRVEHQEQPDARRLEEQVAATVRRAHRETGAGDTLVFLPGAGEIRRSKEALDAWSLTEHVEVLPLHGELSPGEQQRAIALAPHRRVILSTNVAETSLTLPSVTAVVDAGLARVAGHSPWSGLATLDLTKISRASAIQRAGRAGRVQAGACYRLYTKHDFDTRLQHQAPELLRMDLTEILLLVKAFGFASFAALGLIDPPSAAASDAAEALLQDLGASTAAGELSAIGKQMLALPIHPRLARVALEASARGAPKTGALIAALLSERDISLRSRAQFGRDRARTDHIESGPSDVLARIEEFDEAAGSGFSRGICERLQLDATGAKRAARTAEGLSRSLERFAPSPSVTPPMGAELDEVAMISVVAGFGDRIGQRRAEHSRDVVIPAVGSVQLAETSVVREAQFVVAVDAEERKGGAVVRVASKVEPEWLLELFEDRVKEERTVRLDPNTGRIDGRLRLLYRDALLLDESVLRNLGDEEIAAALYEAASQRDFRSFCKDKDEFDAFALRCAFAATYSADVPALDGGYLAERLRELCEGVRSFAELTARDPLSHLVHTLPRSAQTALDEFAPERVTLGGGRGAAIHYAVGQPPWVESRLQDFLGMKVGPTVAKGRVPLVLHLLAPNHRAVQVTTDLAGFWERHYPTIRKELMRRYPRHAWPERGEVAYVPPPKRTAR